MQDFSTMSFEELMAHVPSENSVPQHTVVMHREPTPQKEPEVQARPQFAPPFVPVPRARVQEPCQVQQGRPKFDDPSDPRQLHAIAKRMPVYQKSTTLGLVGPIPFTRIKAQLLRKKRANGWVDAEIVSVATIDGIPTVDPSGITGIEALVLS